MNIHIYQSYKGDCLMIENAAQDRRILVDGGTPAAMKDFVAQELAALHGMNRQIDLLCVSHIDEDHIGGVLALLEGAMEWAVYDYYDKNGSRDLPAKPKQPRAPKIRGLWHNAFRDMVKENVGDIEEMLAAGAPGLQSTQVPALMHIGREYAGIATSIPQAMKVSRLVKADLLNIPVNQLKANSQHNGKLIMARPGQKPEKIGSLKVTILCPTETELEDLKKGWQNWLKDPANKGKPKKIRDEYAKRFANGFASAAGNPLNFENWEGVSDYKNVTVPNVASIVLMVEEKGRQILLTGDSHPDKILAGLRAAGMLDKGPMHIDVLKFPHHGAEANMTEEFGQLISADHYIFCGNGEHHNPEISVLDDVLASRVGPANKLSQSPKSQNRPFTFWFNTTSRQQKNKLAIEHMKEVEDWAKRMKARYPKVFKVKFIRKPCEVLTLDRIDANRMA